jgi:electron transfer flavoprotein beta subunit
MKILVCISRTPDTTSKISFKDSNSKFDDSGVQWIINPYDEWYSLVRAIEIKEAIATTTIHLVTVGTKETEAIIRKAFALGGDEAFRVDTENNDSYYIASQIATIAQQGNYDLVFTGKETLDYNGSSIGGMIAEMLDLPYISLATKFELDNNIATVTREIEGGEEVATANLPLVVSCQKGVAEQRIPNMRGIMVSKSKPLHVVAAKNIEALTNVVAYELPPAKSGVKLVDANNVAELARLLREEAKAI